MDGVYCTNCGHLNVNGSNFCATCGTALPADERTLVLPPVDPLQDAPGEADDVRVELSTLPGESGVLVVRSGIMAGMRLLLDRPIVRLGRHPDSEVTLDDITVSRRHAEIRRTPSGYLLRDTGSLNGTYVNQHRVEEARLANGDEVQVGKFRMVFLDAPGGQA
jgi:hypothetical protein